MKSAAPYKTKNHHTLKTIAANFPVVAALAPAIWDAYRCYHPSKGNPQVVAPMVVPAGVAEQFKAAMEDCYKSGRVRDDLAWLSTYRLKHGYSHCPMCGAAHPKTLEHYLPRAEYPEFAVFALNLVPSCMSCNGHRSASANAHNTNLPMLHPFFDGHHLSVEFLQVNHAGSLTSPTFEPVVRHPDPGIQARVAEHVRRSVDRDLFNTWLLDLLLSARATAARHATVPLLTSELDAQLRDEVRLRGSNTWEAAFLRWLLQDGSRLAWVVANPA